MNIVKALKENEQDFEWYPTTPEIIREINRNFREGDSFLDVGAGRGDVLRGVAGKAGDLYAIEKSQILCSHLPEEAFIVGTDFHRQTLIDKEVGVVFSNPPFSEFVPWACRIIREAKCNTILLVLPQRWKDNKEIECALQARNLNARSVGSFSFLEADRQARGIVNLVKITVRTSAHGYSDVEKADPFNLWFDTEFEVNADIHTGDNQSEPEEAKLHDLVKGQNIVERLEELYIEELSTTIETYRYIAQMPQRLLKEIGVDAGQVKGSLKSKISGMKKKYWNELFNNLDKITSRLTSKSRESMLDKLTANTHIDYTSANAYAVVLWAIRNANKYMDEQLVELYKTMSSPKSVIAYKSNTRFNTDQWRWRINDGQHTHFKLDYRIVYEYGNAFGGYNFERTDNNGISKRAAEFIGDVLTVGKTLGYQVNECVRDFQWSPGEQKTFTFGDGKEFAQVRCYLNGNIHLKLNIEFMRKLNIEAGRILGWIRTPREAAEELQEKQKDVEQYWESSYRLELSDVKLLNCN